MRSDPLQEEKQYYADIIYKNLNSLTRSEDTSLNYYGMELEKQNATEEGFKSFSTIAANIIIENIYQQKREGKDPTDVEIERIIKNSFDEAWKRYNEANN